MDSVAPVLEQLDDGAAGDAGQHGAHGGSGVDFAVDFEHDVHGADFLHVLLLHAVQPQHLAEAQFLGLFARQNGRGIVAAALGKAGQTRRGTDVLVLHIDTHRVKALGIVSAGGCADDHEQVMLGGMNAQPHIGGDAERTDIQRCTVRMGHPIPVDVHQRLDGLDEVLRRDVGHAQTVGGIVEPVGVAVRAEQLHAAIGGAVGLHALKNFLRVVEHRGGRVHGQRAVGDDAGIMPALACGVVHEEHMVGENFAETQLAFVLRLGFRRGGTGNFDVQHNHTLSLCLVSFIIAL